MAPNMHRSLFPICHYVCTYTHNLKTKRCIKTFYLSNDCLSIKDIYTSQLYLIVCEVQLESCGSKYASQPLSNSTLCLLTLITRQLQIVYECSIYWMTALLLKMSIFCGRTGCKIQLVSYGSKHALPSLSNKPFTVRTHMHNLKTTGRIRTFCILNNCSTVEDIACMV